MEPFSARMTLTVKPGDMFIHYYNSIMSDYLEKRSQSSNSQSCLYDILAEKAIKISKEKSLNDLIAQHHSLYILPQNSSSQVFNPDDFFMHHSRTLLNHEFIKWFGTEEIAQLLISETLENTERFLQNSFSVVFYSFFLDLSENTNDSLYLAISLGDYFKKWLIEFAKPDVKTKLNLFKNNPSTIFDSFTTFIVKTNAATHDDLDSFLEKNIDTIIKYERIAWVGNVELYDDALQWPQDLNTFTTFKNWFHIDIYKDIYCL